MDSGTPKIRFRVGPGTSARLSEQEHEVTGPTPSMRIKGGTAARMAEAEPKVAPRGPYGMSMRAQTGKPFTLAELQNGGASLNTSSGVNVDANVGRPTSAVQTDSLGSTPTDGTSSNRVGAKAATLLQHQTVSVSAGGASIVEGGSTGKDEKETQIASRSSFQSLGSFQKLRSFFSRT